MIDGVASIGENNSISFASDQAIPDTVHKFRTLGIVQTLSDGSFDFQPVVRHQSRANRIKKTAHGGISATKDGAILLWVKVYKDEGLDIADTILDEAVDATSALKI